MDALCRYGKWSRKWDVFEIAKIEINFETISILTFLPAERWGEAPHSNFHFLDLNSSLLA